MKRSDIFTLSMRNIRCNTAFSLKIAGMVFICALFLCTMLTYCLSLSTCMDKLVLNKMSMCRNVIISDAETAEKAAKNVREYTITSELDLWQIAGRSDDEVKKIYISSSALEWNGTLYEGVNDFTYDFDINSAASESDYAVPFRIDTLVSGSTLLAEAEKAEFEQKFDNNTIYWLNGRIPENPNEILISDYMLEKYGIPKKKQESLIGQRVSMYLEDNCILKNYTLCGIIDADIFYLHGKENCSQIYITETDKTETFHAPSYIVRLFADDFNEAYAERSDLAEGKYDLLPNETITLFAAISMQQTLIGRTLIAVCAVVLLAMSIALFAMLGNYVQQKSGYYLMLRCMGLQAKQLRRLFFTELLILAIPVLFLGIALSQLIADYILQIASHIQDHSIEILIRQREISAAAVCCYLILWMFVCSIYELSMIKQIWKC